MPIETDTIATISTAPGVSAIAVVRISGPRSDEVLSALLGPDAELPAERTPALRELRDPDDHSVLDRALVTRFRGPGSYTGEDLVEISCHGGWIVPRLLLDASMRSGAREAEPGELTRRAYLHGKLDLVQVEAIADVIEARSRALHRAAVHQLDRNLSSRVSDLRERIVHVEALLAHHVDFPEEDDAPVELGVVLTEAMALVASIEALLATAPEGALLREGAVLVLAGPPNAGKSSLYNALIGDERALVTAEPGTTRDALEAPVQMGGFPFRLIDTAGMRAEASAVERMGIEVAERYLGRADCVLVCVPPTEAGGPVSLDVERLREGAGDASLILVRTKSDLATSGDYAAGESIAGLEDVVSVPVSAVSGEGLDRLRELVAQRVYGQLNAVPVEAPILTRERHARALRLAADEVRGFTTAVEDGLPAEVAATHLRSAETALEEMLGVVSVDDVLDVVFRDFCIGK